MRDTMFDGKYTTYAVEVPLMRCDKIEDSPGQDVQNLASQPHYYGLGRL